MTRRQAPRSNYPHRWGVSSTNKKTLGMAFSVVGAHLDDTFDSCRGCALRGTSVTGKGALCYAWAGRAKRGMATVLRGRPRDMETAYRAAPDKRAVRMGALGDPVRVDSGTLAQEIWTLRKMGVALVGYTHFWGTHEGQERDSHLHFMASCDTVHAAETALSFGHKPALIVPQGTGKVITLPGGARLLRCPQEQAAEVGRMVTCGQCRLCDVPTIKKTKWDGIAFRVHGPHFATARNTKALRALPLADKESK